MDEPDCEKETHMRRMSGWIIVTIGLYVAVGAMLFKSEIGILSIIGYMISITLIGLGGVYVISPESKRCRQEVTKK